ncbi:deoxynucleoside kinase [candidate division KSB1 bacterium]|nr:deoxynucleoside kinase [candidate division KSB1 bacterium]
MLIDNFSLFFYFIDRFAIPENVAKVISKEIFLSPKTFITLAGNIGCGKTTAAKLISQNLGYELFDEPVIDNRFLRQYYADMQRWSFTLQMEFLIRRIEHHELIKTVPKSCVQDRSLYEDPEIFAKYLHGLGHMTDNELNLYYEYFERVHRNLPQPDLIILLQVEDSQILLNRIRARARKEELGITAEFLDGLGGYYVGFPMVCRNKYRVETISFNASVTDIRSKDGRDEFLALVESKLK